MAPRKLAATLGTGTLGAGGAAAAAALNMGNKSQSEISPDTKEQQSDPSREPQTGANENHGDRDNSQTLEGGGTKSPEGQPSAAKTYFANATPYDIKAVDSKNWKKEEATNDGGIAIKIEEDNGNSWQCTIKGFVFGNNKDKSQIDEQVKQFVEKIKTDDAKRNKFVENCSKNRLDTEKAEGKVSTIELEVEENSGNLKLKDLDKLLSDDFMGLSRLEGNYQTDHEDAEDWSFTAKEEDKKIVVKLLKDLTNEFCSIYGEFEGTGFKEGDFDNDSLSKFFNGSSYGEDISNEDKLTNLEKRKFLIRNCLANNKKIEGVKMVKESGKWKIKELLTKMYKNPEKTKGQQPQENV